MCAEAENEAEKIQAQPWWRERAIRRGDTEKGRGGDGRRLGDGEAGFPGASHTEELGWGKGRSGSQLTGMFGYPEWQACQSGIPLSLAARCSPFTAMFFSAPWHFPRCELKPSGFCALPAPPPPTTKTRHLQRQSVDCGGPGSRGGRSSASSAHVSPSPEGAFQQPRRDDFILKSRQKKLKSCEMLQDTEPQSGQINCSQTKGRAWGPRPDQ